MVRRVRCEVIFDGLVWTASSVWFPDVVTSSTVLAETLRLHALTLRDVAGVAVEVDPVVTVTDPATEAMRAQMRDLRTRSSALRTELHTLNMDSHAARHELIRHLLELGLPVASIAKQSGTSRAQTASIVREILDQGGAL